MDQSRQNLDSSRSLVGVLQQDKPYVGQLNTRVSFAEKLHLGYNSLTGVLPTEIFKTIPRLSESVFAAKGSALLLLIFVLSESLGFAANILTGTIPTEVGLMSALGKQKTMGQQLLQDKPHCCSQPPEHVEFTNNNFQGSIPSQIGGLTRLSTLRVTDCFFLMSENTNISFCDSNLGYLGESA